MEKHNKTLQQIGSPTLYFQPRSQVQCRSTLLHHLQLVLSLAVRRLFRLPARLLLRLDGHVALDRGRRDDGLRDLRAVQQTKLTFWGKIRDCWGKNILGPLKSVLGAISYEVWISKEVLQILKYLEISSSRCFQVSRGFNGRQLFETVPYWNKLSQAKGYVFMVLTP